MRGIGCGLLSAAVGLTAQALWEGVGATSRAAKGSPNIVLITVDTLRADHLGCYGYFRDTSPHVDALAGESLVFTRACAPMATTFPSHLSLFTAVYPAEHGYLSNTRLIDSSFEPTPALRTVAQMLKVAGYSTAAFTSAAPVRDTTGLGAGFDLYVQPEKDDWKLAGMRRADETIEAFLAWLAAAPREPYFVWIHLFDPHWPYDAPAPFDRRFATDDRLKAWVEARRTTMMFPQKWKKQDALTIHDLYDGEVRYVDEQIGRALRALRQGGAIDRAVVILTADHGEGLGQHNWPAHGDLHEEQMHVPLMIRLPASHRRAPARINAVVSLIDVFPTVLAALDSPAGKAMQAQATGVDVLAPDFRRDGVFSERTDHSEGWGPGRRFALTQARWRYYHQTEGGDELYDHSSDPHELRNLIDAETEVASRMKGALLDQLKVFSRRSERFAEGRTHPPQAPDEDMKGALQGLGYVEDEAHGTKTDTPGAPPGGSPATPRPRP